jgi:hypothetical protein
MGCGTAILPFLPKWKELNWLMLLI